MKIKANGTYKAAESQLRNMNKEQLIAYIRTLEYNWETATEALINQANYIEEQKTYKRHGLRLRKSCQSNQAYFVPMHTEK